MAGDRRPRRASADVPPRGLEDGQPRLGAGRTHDPARLGHPRRRCVRVRAGVVARAEHAAPAERPGREHRDLPRRARTARHRHLRVVGARRRHRLARHARPVRLGEGVPRSGRGARLVGRACRGRPGEVVTVDEYAGAADAWAGNVAAVYARLARAVVADCPIPLAGARVLDLGAGTGVVSALAVAGGAYVVAADLSPNMLGFEHERRPPAAVADVFALPFRAASFDAALAACLVNHFADPASALRSAATTVRSGGAVVASSFGAEPDAVKEAVDGVARSHGWVPPEWYLTIKRASSTHLADPERFAATGRAAGLVGVVAQRHDISMSSLSVEQAVAYRLSLPPFTAWLRSLSPSDHERV